jgi:hypothetical protein
VISTEIGIHADSDVDAPPFGGGGKAGPRSRADDVGKLREGDFYPKFEKIPAKHKRP